MCPSGPSGDGWARDPVEEVLPDDLLADVLGRLPPSSLAASRCVRKHWCSIIDARRLLRADLLPLRLDAFYCIHLDLIDRLTYLFARPSAARRIPGGCLDFLQDYLVLEVQDHCNGLLLLCDMVANPATRQWANLPTSPEPSIADMLGTTTNQDQQENDDHLLSSCFFLVYDPMAESPQHFEVFLIPLFGRDPGNINTDLKEQEWPPATFRIHVFSSRRWRWEERSWIRQGEPAGTVADMLQSGCWERKAVYFWGALYVHCQNDSVMRISLSNDNKYQMVKSPETRSKLGAERATFYLGKSEKGVYCALLYRVDFGSCPYFRVWLLKEEEEINEDGNHIIHMEWVLKTNISLQLLLAKPPRLHNHHNFADDEWRVIRYYNDEELGAPPTAVAAATAHDHDDEFADDDLWDFDNADDIVNKDTNNAIEADQHYPFDFLGFHPYKDIVFFSLSSRTISYNFNTSKVQSSMVGRQHMSTAGHKYLFPIHTMLADHGGII